MAGKNYWPKAGSNQVVKDLCNALATNLDPKEHIIVHLKIYHFIGDHLFTFEVRRVHKGDNIILWECGTTVCRGYKERLDIVRAICNSPKHIVEIIFGYRYASEPDFQLWDQKKVLEEWRTLMLGLKNRSTLRSLTLNMHRSSMKMNMIFDHKVASMASMLACHPSLMHFTLEWCYLHSNKPIACLAKALSMNTKIKTLTLDHCEVDAKALDILLQPFIPNDSGIQYKLQGLYLLGVQYCKEDESIGSVINNMLQKNTTLYEFNVSSSFMGSTYANKFFINILKGLKENQHLKRVKFGGDDFGGKKILVEVKNLLRMNPSLKIGPLHDTNLHNGGSRELIQPPMRRIEQYLAVLNNSFQTIAPTSARVFFCGFPHAGKTTLRKQLAQTSLLSKMNVFQKARFKLHREQSTRTIGIEVDMVDTTDSTTLQLWDLGGHDEFHALHDLVVPNIGDNGGAYCIFLLVCSLMNSPHNTTLKDEQNIKQELQYWLKFILSNSTWSQTTCRPHVIIAFTHTDLIPKNLDAKDYVKELMGSLRKFCGNSIDIYEERVFYVNAKSQTSIIQLATFLEGDVSILLRNGPKVNEACVTMEVALAKLNKTKPHKPFLRWEEFTVLCQEQEAFIALFDEASDGLQKICKALAMALHDSGHVMYFESLEFVVVDPNWFCNKILGPVLSRVDEVAHDSHKGKAPRSSDGYMEAKVFKSILEDSFLDKKNVKKGMKEVEGVKMDDVIELMKKMNLCYSCDSNVAKFSQQEDSGMPMPNLFIPATLKDENGDAQQGRRQLSWISMASSSSSSFVYVGRRLQCEDVDRTFLTLGFFPRLQVVCRRTLGSPDNFSLEKNLISFTYNGMEVFVEYSGHVAPMHLNNLIDGYIDILVKSSRDLDLTLQFVQEKMVNQIRELCSSPTFGCQGVILVESILNPTCVEKLWLCVDRKNHAIEVEKLVQDVLIANDLEYMHEWPLRGPKEKRSRSGPTKAKLLLGDRKWEVTIVDKLYMGLKEIGSSLVAECVPIDVQGLKDDHVDTIPQLATFFKHEIKRRTKEVIDHIDMAENRLATKMDAIVALQHRLLPEISRNIDKVISFSEQLQQRQVPCITYITTKDVDTCQWLITSLVPGLSSVQLHFLCEHEGGIHRVESQKGDVLVLEGETLRGIRPYIVWGLRILSILMKAGAQSIVGGGSMVPNLEKMLLKGMVEMIPKVSTNFGEGGVPIEQVNLDMKFQNYEREVAEQWLVNFLKGKDIGVLFGLYRIKYKTSAKIAWVCKEHKEEGLENGNMVLLPTF